MLIFRTDSLVWAASEADEEVCEVASVWVDPWAEEALFLASEADSVVPCEADSEVEVALAHQVDSLVPDTWLADGTLATTCMPITTVPRVVSVVLPPSHLACEPSLPSPTSRS
jgi:hypothetical protein